MVVPRGLTSRPQPQPLAAGLALGMMIFKFHISVKTEGAVAVGCSDLLGHTVTTSHNLIKLKPKQPGNTYNAKQQNPRHVPRNGRVKPRWQAGNLECKVATRQHHKTSTRTQYCQLDSALQSR